MTARILHQNASNDTVEVRFFKFYPAFEPQASISYEPGSGRLAPISEPTGGLKGVLSATGLWDGRVRWG